MSNYLTCQIGQEWYAIQIDYVIEVFHIVALNRVPDDDVVGVMTLREQVIPVIDLRKLMGLAELKYDMELPIIALQHNDQKLGVIVDDADEVERIEESDMTPYSNKKGIRAMARINEQMLFVLDVENLFRSLNMNVLPVEYLR